MMMKQKGKELEALAQQEVKIEYLDNVLMLLYERENIDLEEMIAIYEAIRKAFPEQYILAIPTSLSLEQVTREELLAIKNKIESILTKDIL